MAARAKKKHSSARFIGFMLAYAMFFAIVTFAGVRYFWDYLVDYQAEADAEQAAYELSLPDTAIKSYIASFDEDHIRDVSADFLNGLDSNLQSEDSAFNQVLELFSGDLNYAKTSASSSLVTYDISNSDTVLGTVSFTFNGTLWEFNEETFNFDFLKGSSSVTVPYNYTVSCNGVTLDESYITESDIPFDILADFSDYSDMIDMPYLVTYTISEYIGQAEFDVTDSLGKEITVPENAPQDMFIDNYTDEVYDNISEYLSRYIPIYIKYTSNADGNRYGNLQTLLQYILPGTSLEERMRGALEGLYYAHSRSDTLNTLTINHIMVLNDSYYMADITYLVDTVGNEGLVTTTNNVRLIITENENGKFTVAQTSY